MKQKLHLGTSWVFIGFLALLEGCIGLLDPTDYNKGLIVSDYPISAPADKWSCYVSDFFGIRSQLSKNNIIIDSDTALQAYFDYARFGQPVQNYPDDPCRNYQPEQIDFSKYTLLGNYADGGCDVAFTRTVEQDNQAKKYSYTVKVREAGACKKLVYSMNWVLVPKLPLGYTVEFLLK